VCELHRNVFNLISFVLDCSEPSSFEQTAATGVAATMAIPLETNDGGGDSSSHPRLSCQKVKPPPLPLPSLSPLPPILDKPKMMKKRMTTTMTTTRKRRGTFPKPNLQVLLSLSLLPSPLLPSLLSPTQLPSLPLLDLKDIDNNGLFQDVRC
jgi:hypothetical protein